MKIRYRYVPSSTKPNPLQSPMTQAGLLVLTMTLGFGVATRAVSAAADSSGGAAADQSSALEEIQVTATRESQPLSKAPLAVTALTQEQLQEAGVVSLENLTASVPDVQMRSVFNNSIQVTVRGITNTDFNELGNPAVATYIDGALYDLDRVEVLRGPQGTLYGRNATGGNINIATAAPTAVFASAFDVSYGSYNDVLVHGMVNTPVTDTLAVRAAFVSHRSDGYTDTGADRNYGADDDFGGRISALWTPTDKFTWHLSVDDYIAKGTPVANIVTNADGQPFPGASPYRPNFTNTLDPKLYINNTMVRSRMDWTMTDWLTASFIAGYQHLDSEHEDIFGLPNSAAFDGEQSDFTNGYSSELDFLIKKDALTNILGGNFFAQNNVNHDAYHIYTLGVDEGVYNRVHDSSWGVFDQATYSIIESLRVVGGIRYSHESASALGSAIDVCQMASNPNLPLGTIHDTGYDAPGCAPFQQTPGNGSWSNVSWKAGLEYDVTDHVLSYASATTGFKSGGLNVGTASPATFAPETIINYELGIKARSADNRASLNTAVFFENYSNVQETENNPSATAVITQNAAKARIYGVELEGQWRPTRADFVRGFFDYLHATFTDFTVLDTFTGVTYTNRSGNYLQNSPTVSGKLQYGHEFDLPGDKGSLTPNVGVYAQTDSYLRPFNIGYDHEGGYAKYDANLSYETADKRWHVEAYGFNLGNRAIRTSGFGLVGYYLSTYDAPRTLGIRISTKF
jgi:iron complex outermembrane receptor protein